MSVQYEASADLPSEIMSGTLWTRGRVGPNAGLDVLEKKKSLFSSGIPTPDLPSRSLVTTLTKLANFVEFLIRLMY
jgi:hypothetical protein